MSDLRPTLAGARGRALPLAVSTGAWEAPTLCLAAVIYGGLLALTLAWHALPLVLALPLGAWLLAWHSSLQHEIIHDHPTPYRRLTTRRRW